ncbi:MAG TPA: hypothetical protein VNO75_05415 [Gemmatimonadaceae bacterium]|nr:hypothetical protein [Gemmatimonadaceae bacterium]
MSRHERISPVTGFARMIRSLRRSPAIALVAGCASIASAQHHPGADSAARFAAGAHAIALVTRQSPALQGSRLTEGYLTQPTVMGHARVWRDALTLQAMLSLEGWTLERGELNPGIVGEGYIDRRHPHTYLHEIVATLERGVGGRRASLAVGKGFAPFGTDDPMGRPFAKYPINHHLAQVLERVVAIVSVGVGPLVLEAGSFNGDEPEGSGDAPNASRWWDSWAGRATLTPLPAVEMQLSYASVRSPEHAGGGGPDDRKWSSSMRYESTDPRRYALAEWARTAQYVGATRSFSFNSLLVEGESELGPVAVAARLEVTERPDEERLLDPFRTLRPGHDFSIVGRSRWTIATARITVPLALRPRFALHPFVEVAHHRVRETLRPSGFNPTQFYGSDRIWTVSSGLRLAFGMPHRRMGRYGVASGQ